MGLCILELRIYLYLASCIFPIHSSLLVRQVYRLFVRTIFLLFH